MFKMHVAAHVYMCVCVHVKPQRSTDPSAYFHEAMGRLKGIVEVTLEGTEVSQVAADLKQAMPDVVTGAVSVDAGNLTSTPVTVSRRATEQKV